MNAITVRDLKKSYGSFEAVKGISFDVKEGELFSFLGENGAGKSTTINMLCTVLKKTEGSVKVFDYELGKDDDNIRNLIGIVFQNSVLDKKLTVKENLLTRGAYYGYSKKEVMKNIEGFMDSFLLDKIWNQKYESLSGGQRRRVDIVRALINKPKILFLDEPTTGLDPMSRKMVWDYIDYLRKQEKMTIFLTTHYMEETRDADNVVILDKGCIMAEGTPVELKDKYSKNRVVWYAEESSGNEALLKGIEHNYDSNHYNIFINENVTEFLYKTKSDIIDYEVIKGSMDDVFLTLTGKELKNA